MKSRLSLFLLFTAIFILVACEKEPVEEANTYPVERITIPQCDLRDTHINDTITPVALEITDALIHGHIDLFSDPCKAVDEAPMVLSDSTRPTFRMTYELPGNYPVSHIDITNFIGDPDLQITAVNIEISSSGRSFRRIENDLALDETTTTVQIGENITHLRIIFDATPGTGNHAGPFFGLHDVRFFMGPGFKIDRSPYHTDPFFRFSGWTGADGIFTYNLSHDNARHIGSESDNVLFIFSDTFIGEVYPHNRLRHRETIVNNTIAYLDTSLPFSEGLDFYYTTDEEDNPGSLYTPEHYTGYHPTNLMNGDGLDIFPYPEAVLSSRAPGHVWRGAPSDDTLIFDFKEPQAIYELIFYADPETPAYTIRDFRLLSGDTLDSLAEIGVYSLDIEATTSGQPLKRLTFDQLDTRFLKIEILNNHETDPSVYALGKLLAFDGNGNFLHAEVEAGYLDTTDPLEKGAILWLQDSVIIGDYFYNFPILVKNNPETDFKVHKVGLSKTPIVNGRLDYDNAVYLDTPLQVRTEDGGEIFYGAGVLDMTNHPSISDAYIYIYGYKDLEGRHLTVARVTPENIENFNAYEFFDGETFQRDIRKSHMGIKGVSAELSITHIPSGVYEDKYMLVSMEDTISGRVVYSIGDTPFGPFEPFTTIYHAPEPHLLDFAFTYNAKMHPLLSEEGVYVITYNVNGYRAMALKNARVYNPRFIIMTEIRSD